MQNYETVNENKDLKGKIKLKTILLDAISFESTPPIVPLLSEKLTDYKL